MFRFTNSAPHIQGLLYSLSITVQITNLLIRLLTPLPQVCCAKMADFRRNFSDAARRYIQLSYDPAIHSDERVQSLKHAMVCAILSHAG